MSEDARSVVNFQEIHNGTVAVARTKGNGEEFCAGRPWLTDGLFEVFSGKRRFFLLAAAFWLCVLCLAFDNSMALFMHNWPITPVAFVAAAFANATAIGGGFLFVPLFILAYGLTPIAALKLSLATQAFGMTFGALGWSRKFIVMRALLIASVASVIGMAMGTYWFAVSNAQVKSIFAWMSLFIFIVILLEIRFGRGSANSDIGNDSPAKTGFFALACVAGGMITAWTAIGVGEVVALYLLFAYRIRIDAAIGTGVAVLAVDSLAGLLFHSHLGGITWEYLVFTAPGVALGGYCGARFGRNIENRKNFRTDTGRLDSSKRQSPLKWLFGTVIFVDSMVMLAQQYVF